MTWVWLLLGIARGRYAIHLWYLSWKAWWRSAKNLWLVELGIELLLALRWGIVDWLLSLHRLAKHIHGHVGIIRQARQRWRLEVLLWLLRFYFHQRLQCVTHSWRWWRLRIRHRLLHWYLLTRHCHSKHLSSMS